MHNNLRIPRRILPLPTQCHSRHILGNRNLARRRSGSLRIL
jgi:hypothetical protein